MMAVLGPPRFALQPLGCHHGPWAGRKTHDPSGRGSVMYQWHVGGWKMDNGISFPFKSQTRGKEDHADLMSLSIRYTVLEERVNHDIALSSERDEVDRKKRHAADTTHFLFDSI
jgi:hypothetical protein